MTLASGSRLGAYEIVAPLGAGGMGEVFRAIDTRLGREVALKRLPPAFANEPERVARFDREAKLLAALRFLTFGMARLGSYDAYVMEVDKPDQPPVLIVKGNPRMDEPRCPRTRSTSSR